MLNLSEEDMASPLAAMLTAGVGKLWSVKAALQTPQEFTGEVPDSKREEFHAKVERETELRSRMYGLDKPLWQTLSGLEPEGEAEMSPREREASIRRLLGAVIKLVKFEMDEAEKQKDDWRSFMWDPLPKVCFYLQISRTKLTKYAKEAMGLSAHEIVDGIRVQKLRERMKEVLRGFVLCQVNGISKELGEKVRAGDELSFAVWKRLKFSRRTPKWDRQTWALSLGFPNYSRMYRACLVLFGKTPAQLEFEVIEELCLEIVESDAVREVQNISSDGSRSEGPVSRASETGDGQKTELREVG